MRPIIDILVKIPEVMTGSVIPEPQIKRVIIQGINNDGNYQLIKGQIPKSEIDNFSSQLRSMTQGRGTFVTSLKSYDAVPTHIQQ